MTDPVARLNTALEGRYAMERELGEGRMAVRHESLGEATPARDCRLIPLTPALPMEGR